MPSKIEDYAIIGDTKTVALVDLTGSIDWWCAPRIDSAAAFAALLGDAGNGRWLIAPKGEVTKVTRRYEPETLILETIFETSTGSVSVCDFMPPHDGQSMIHRIVESRGGTVEMQMELIVRYEYGAVTPWATATSSSPAVTVSACTAPSLWLARTTPALPPSPFRATSAARSRSPGSPRRSTLPSLSTASPPATTRATTGTTGSGAAPTPADGATWSSAR
jgi:hypothetical protein